jgi:hypothetical protein
MPLQMIMVLRGRCEEVVEEARVLANRRSAAALRYAKTTLHAREKSPLYRSKETY